MLFGGFMSEDYNALSVAELRQIIKDKGIKNTSSLRKAQLVQILTELAASVQKEIPQEAEKE